MPSGPQANSSSGGLRRGQHLLPPPDSLPLAEAAKLEKDFDNSEDEEGSLKKCIDNGGSKSSSSDLKTSSSGSDSDESRSEKPKHARMKTRGQGAASDLEDEPPAPSKHWWSELITEEQMDDVRQSSKIFLFFTILKYCEEIGDKMLIFSKYLNTLDLLEYFLNRIGEENRKPEKEQMPGIKGFEGSREKGLDYFRLDGTSACKNREIFCKSFNQSENLSIKMSVTGDDQNSEIPARVRKILEPTEEEKEFRLKSYPDVATVEDAKILCTICQNDVKHIFLLKKKSYKHIFLKVAVCKLHACRRQMDAHASYAGDFGLSPKKSKGCSALKKDIGTQAGEPVLHHLTGGFVERFKIRELEEKVAKLEKERTVLKRLCKIRSDRIHELESQDGRSLSSNNSTK